MEIRTEAVFEAPRADVWGVLVDFERYGDWNPVITRVRGKATLGARLEVDLASTDGTVTTLRPKIIALDEETELRWRSSQALGLLRGEHFFKLSDADGGGTCLVHGEDFSGPAVKLLMSGLAHVHVSFAAMNKALGRRVASRRASAR